MTINALKTYLDAEGVKYVTIQHSPAYTANELAASAHISEAELAKTVIVQADDAMVMVVVPASRRVGLERLREITGSHGAELVPEAGFQSLFPDCDVGAMPPFGHLYGMQVYVSHELAEDEEIVFNAGSHTELMRLAYKDFARLEEPQVVEF